MRRDAQQVAILPSQIGSSGVLRNSALAGVRFEF
jgi:hypothetical protein